MGFGSRPFILTMDEGSDYHTLRRAVATACVRLPEDILLAFPAQHPRHVAIRGRRVSCIKGVRLDDNADTADGIGIFLNTRKLGQPICFVVLPTAVTTLAAVCEAAGIQRPTGWRLQAEGVDVYDESTGRMYVTNNAAIRLSVRPFVERRRVGHRDGAASPEVSDDSENSDGPDGDACSQRSRSPRHRSGAVPPWRSPERDIGEADTHPAESLGGADDIQPPTFEPAWADCSQILTALEDAIITKDGYGILLRAIGVVEVQLARGSSHAPPMPKRAVATPCRADVVLPQLQATCPNVTETKVAVSLADAIGPQQHDIAVHTLQVIKSHDLRAIWRLIRPWRSLCWGSDLSGYDLHANTTAALALCSDPHLLPTPEMLEIYTDGSAKHEHAGFAVVIVGQWLHLGKTALLGCFGGPVVTDPEDPRYVRAERQDAYNAEVSALAWTVFWLLGNWDQCGRPWVRIRYDALVAGNFTSGYWQPQNEGIAVFCREAARLMEHCLGAYTVEWGHVPAHSGHPWNELADVVADGFMRRLTGAGTEPDTGWDFCVGHIDLQWAVLVPLSCRPGGVPLNQSGQLTWSEHEGSPQQLATHKVIPVWDGFAGRQISLDIVAISANVQTCVGKYKYLEEQMTQFGAHILCLQEAKCQEGCTRTDDYLRFASDGQKHWGVEIWFSKRRSCVALDGKDIFVDESNLHVLSSSHRHLHMVMDVAAHKIHVASFHFPHQARPEEEKEQYCVILRDILSQADGHALILGIDANARLPTSFQQVTGQLHLDEEDVSGRMLASVFAENDCWVPSTYYECQFGQGYTWTHASGNRSRIDYFVVGPTFPRPATTTMVLDEFDLMTPNPDHEAIQVRVRHSFVHWGRDHARLKRGQQYDIRCLSNPHYRALFEDELDRSGIFCVDWDVDVNTHAFMLQQAVNYALSAVLPSRKDKPRSAYVPEEAWSLRQRKLAHKRRTAHRRSLFKSQVLKAALEAWRGTSVAAYGSACLEFAKMRLLYAVHAGAVQIATHRMQRLIRECKNSMLQRLAGSFGTSRSDVIMTKLKSLHIGRRKQSPWRRCLPNLQGQEGVVSSRQDLDNVWLRHFGDMEFGVVEEAHEFFKKQVLPAAPDGDFEPDLMALPSLGEIETAFRGTKCHKSPGLDMLHGEVLHKVPGRMAAAALPLFLKAAMHRVQPIQWKGGILAESFKGKSSPSDPASYRSLYVSSMLGKAYHKVLREKALPVAGATFGAGHFAAKKGSPVSTASLMIQLFERWRHQQLRSTAILFLDIQSAYYSVVRQLAYGDSCALDMDSQVQAVMRHFGLPPAAWNDLLEAVRSGGIMGTAGAGGHLRELIRDSHDGSFFVTRYSDGSRVCSTHAGSRPGEAMADMIYAWIFHAVLKDIEADLRAAGVLEQIPFSGEHTPFLSDQHESVDLLGPTWADDSTFACSDADPGCLVAKTETLVAAVVDRCLERSLVPNLKVGKTSLLVNLRGRGAHKEQTRLFAGGARHLTVHTRHRGLIEVPVVQTYVHLGCAVEKGVTLQCEAHRRGGIAAAAFEPLRAMVFQNTAIPLFTTGRLLTVFVDSTYFNLEVWKGPADPGWRRLELGHQKVMRRVLARDFPADEVVRLTPVEVTCLTAHPPLLLLLRSRRLRFLICLLKAAPPVLWALIQMEGAWGRQLLDDLEWLRQFDVQEWPQVAPSTWPCWWHRISGAPNAFRRAVARAMEKAMVHYVADGLKNAHDAAMNRLVGKAYPEFEDAERATCWVCPPCKTAYRSKANLACHFFKRHGRVAQYRLYQGEPVCPCCLKNFFDDHRIRIHLRNSPACWDFAVGRGLCGGSAMAGVGSRAWRELRKQNPIVCPPQEQEVVALPSGCHRGGTGSPVQDVIDCFAGRVGEWLEAQLEEVTLESFLAYLASAVQDLPLFPDEFCSATLQLEDDIRVCAQDPANPWCKADVPHISGLLARSRVLLQGTWFTDCILGTCEAQHCRPRISKDHAMRVRARIGQCFQMAQLLHVQICGCAMDERTRIVSLLGRLPWPLTFCEGFCKEARDVAIHVCLHYGEAAASEADVEKHSPAALKQSCIATDLEQARHLRTVLRTWKLCWQRLLAGSVAGIVCNGPCEWSDLVKTQTLASSVCEWGFVSEPPLWVLAARPAGASECLCLLDRGDFTSRFKRIYICIYASIYTYIYMCMYVCVCIILFFEGGLMVV